MRVLIVILGIIGTYLLVAGISGWIKALNSGDVVSGFLGLTFSMTFAIIGGVVLLLDILLLVFYLVKKKKHEAIVQ